MTNGSILTIAGLIATVAFGVWGVYTVLRKRYPGEVSLVVNDCIGLFDVIMKNFPDLSILYQNNPVSHGLVLFKGTFLNSGRKDITPEMVEQQFRLSLPEDFHWLSAKTIETSNNVKATISVNSGHLEFDTGLFRCGEYFRFEALAEVPISHSTEKIKSIESKLIDELNPTHRIADTGRIRSIILPPDFYTKNRFRKRILMPCTMIFLGIILSIFFIIRGWPMETHYMYSDADGKTHEVTVKPLRDSTLKVKSADKSFVETMPIDQFYSCADLKPKTVPCSEAKYTLLVTILLYVFAPLIWLIVALSEQRKWTKLRKKIGLNKKPQQGDRKVREKAGEIG